MGSMSRMGLLRWRELCRANIRVIGDLKPGCYFFILPASSFILSVATDPRVAAFTFLEFLFGNKTVL